MVALVKSSHEYDSSKANQINAIGAKRENVAFVYGGFYAFRDETTRQKWPVSVQTDFSKRLILSIG
jgi:hypothetical protein